MENHKSLIELKNITRTYDVKGVKQDALKDFSYYFKNVGLYGIIGKSGSGKSTLLNIIGLLDEPSSGDYFYLGESTKKWKRKRKRLFHLNEVGMIFQHYNLLENETVIFNIMIPLLIRGSSKKQAEEAAIKLLDDISFKKDLYQQKVFNLSGGEKQRVALLRALMNNPKIILADEPTGALDSRNSHIVMDTLKEISKSKLVIMVSHNVSLVNQYSDYIISLKDGKLTNKETL